MWETKNKLEKSGILNNDFHIKYKNFDLTQNIYYSNLSLIYAHCVHRKTA